MKERILFVSDLHMPYHNTNAVKELMINIQLNDYKTIVLGGDILDMISPSSFDKHPYEEGTLQDELDMYYGFMTELRNIYKGKIVYLIGNHETRVQKYLKRNHELHGLKALRLENLLKCKEFNIKLCYDFVHKQMLFTHGKYCNKYSANKELDVNGMSGISGHVHRHSVATKTDRIGMKVWISAPCMQDFTKQEFAPNPSWTSGWVELTFNSKRLIDYKVRFL